MKNIKELKVLRHGLGVGRRRRNRSYIYSCVESTSFLYIGGGMYIINSEI